LSIAHKTAIVLYKEIKLLPTMQWFWTKQRSHLTD